MTTSSSISHEITTINYTLSWPHLHHPSNTTFAGLTQLDFCACGSTVGRNRADLGHLYTRYRCARPQVSFTSPDDELWVLHAPLGQVNLLRPARPEEIERRKEICDRAEPAAYAGKNLLLLTGPCPRGRYQAYATLSFLRSLPSAARQSVECLSLLIQPYEEDCSDDQGGRAYVELARYILEELPAFTTLCLNIWGEETKHSTREFAMVLWREGVKIVVTWDWWSDKTEEYTDVEDFLRGIEIGVVEERPPWGGLRQGSEDEADDNEGEDGGISTGASGYIGSPSSSRETLVFGGRAREEPIWEEVPASTDQEEQEVNTHDYNTSGSSSQIEEDPEEDVLLSVESSEDDWTDAILTPTTAGTESSDGDGTWHRL